MQVDCNAHIKQVAAETKLIGQSNPFLFFFDKLSLPLQPQNWNLENYIKLSYSALLLFPELLGQSEIGNKNTKQTFPLEKRGHLA